MLPQALAPLAAWPQFILFTLVPSEKKPGKFDKIPKSGIHGYGASTTNPGDWTTYDKCAEMWRANPQAYHGIGFVFTERDPFFFLDIDNALVNGAWSMVAQELCARFAGAAVEVSLSGTGLHIIGTCTKGFAHGSRNVPLGLEFYTKERFVALSTTHAQGSASANMDAVVPGIVAQFFTKTLGEKSDEWTTVAVDGWKGPEDDGELLVRMLRSGGQSANAAFGGGGTVSFHDLWTANADAIAKKWPPNRAGDGFDHSSADLALANLLAFWTGGNCERMERLMRMSALVRAKWDERDDYLPNTILQAVGLIKNYYVEKGRGDPPPHAPPPPAHEVEAAGFTPRVGAAPIMLAGAQLEHFTGCVYVTSHNKVLTPRGDRLDQARFDVVYGGHEFVVSADGRKTTGSAFEAFTKNHNYHCPRADRLCFRPEHGSGGLVMAAGLTLANTYVHVSTEEADGDPSKYLDLLRRQLPHEGDREILLNWMASVKQNVGLKAQWWPVLQGMEGNAKTFHLSVMVHVVGDQYAHLPATGKMIRNGMNFNGWIEGKRFIGLEEVNAANRREFFEDFKTTVTNRRLPIEGKGVEETTGDNRANGIITTNHKGGVPIDRKSRRYAVFFTAQQDAGDLERDGMTSAYFADLHDWFYGRNAYAEMGADYGARVINRYLATYPLKAEYDPAQLATRAPLTSSMEEAVSTSRGRAEQEILEAIDEERPGFAGGWVSSLKLDELMERHRFNIPRNQRRDIMRSLGFDYHPALSANHGRATTVVAPDNGKPRLYVRGGSIPALNITAPGDACKAYSDAQLRASGEKSAAGQAFK